jgi:hypothetical protein
LCKYTETGPERVEGTLVWNGLPQAHISIPGLRVLLKRTIGGEVVIKSVSMKAAVFSWTLAIKTAEAELAVAD